MLSNGYCKGIMEFYRNYFYRIKNGRYTCNFFFQKLLTCPWSMFYKYSTNIESMHIKISISACPSGTFWTNCSLVCPDGYYGMFCKEMCDCKTSECDKAVGCPKKGNPNLNHHCVLEI